jgi:hypothetical protein
MSTPPTTFWWRCNTNKWNQGRIGAVVFMYIPVVLAMIATIIGTTTENNLVQPDLSGARNMAIASLAFSGFYWASLMWSLWYLDIHHGRLQVTFWLIVQAIPAALFLPLWLLLENQKQLMCLSMVFVSFLVGLFAAVRTDAVLMYSGFYHGYDLTDEALARRQQQEEQYHIAVAKAASSLIANARNTPSAVPTVEVTL